MVEKANIQAKKQTEEEAADTSKSTPEERLSQGIKIFNKNPKKGYINEIKVPKDFRH